MFAIAVRSFLYALIVFVGDVGSAVALCNRNSIPETPFDVGCLSQHVKVLASDEFEGRAPASRGETKTIKYIGEQFARLKLEPAGDSGGWTQQVSLRKFELSRAARVTAKSSGRSSQLKFGDEFVAVSLAGTASIDIREAPVVFVGYGVTAPELGWDDFKGVDVRGKVVMFLINDPDFEAAAPGKFGGKAMTYYGRWVYKFEEAARRGAAAALIVHEDAPASYGWTTVQTSWSVPQFDIVRDNPGEAHPPIEGWLHRDTAARLLTQAGLSLEDLKNRAKRADFKPTVLSGIDVSIQASVLVASTLSHNVIARIPGRSRPAESVVYGAHWDHLGMGSPDSTGDRVYHGAADNASGVAGLLELARVFASKPRTQRSVYFVAFTGEEKGLLGSQYFALHPPMHLDRVAAVFNMDLFSSAGQTCDMSIRGNANSSLHESLALALKAQSRVLSPDAHLEAGYFYRSDHFPFAKLGVPAVAIMSGYDLFEGGTAAGQLAYQEYISQRYHRQADKWSPDWDLRGAALDLDVIFRVGTEIADSATWPEWFEGTEFKRFRDQSADMRKCLRNCSANPAGDRTKN